MAGRAAEVGHLRQANRLARWCLTPQRPLQVYRGCLDNTEDVAVKFLHSYRLEHRDLQAFLTEIAILHTCRHPCIVELKGAFLGQVDPGLQKLALSPADCGTARLP